MKISKIYANEVLDSRGNPTVEATVILDNGVAGRGIVPSGASTGIYEAVELRDNDKERYNGKGVLHAVDNINSIIARELQGISVFAQDRIDGIMLEVDGTKNKAKLGANAILAVSLAVARAGANVRKMPLYRYIGGISAKSMPTPMMNILNGGKHADNNLNIQEFMIVPNERFEFSEKIRICVEVYHTLKGILKLKGQETCVGDEGGFAPNLESDEEALEFIMEAIKKAGYTPGSDLNLALDVAASEMYRDGQYYFWKTNESKSLLDMIEYFSGLTMKYPIISIEDPLAEEDYDGFLEITTKLGEDILVVGDDLFVTNTSRLKKGIDMGIANSILIKLNQIGTLTETLSCIITAKKYGYTPIISHRSGETEDSFIADLAVATNTRFIKTGAPARSERVAKYNRLLNIEYELGRK